MDWTLQLEAGGFFCSLRLRSDLLLCHVIAMKGSLWVTSWSSSSSSCVFLFSLPAVSLHSSFSWMDVSSLSSAERNLWLQMVYHVGVLSYQSYALQNANRLNGVISCYLFLYYSVNTDGDTTHVWCMKKREGKTFCLGWDKVYLQTHDMSGCVTVEDHVNKSPFTLD